MSFSISQGRFHEYLGIICDFNIKEDVMITMYDKIDNIIEEAPKMYT